MSNTEEGSRPDTLKACPYCGEAIKLIAIKCKHCGSMLSNDLAGVQSGSEQVLMSTDINLMKGINPITGRLSVTAQRLVFEPQTLFKTVEPVSLLLGDIGSMERRNNLGVLPNGLWITTTDGRTFKFVAWQRDAIIRSIEASLAPASGAAPLLKDAASPVIESAFVPAPTSAARNGGVMALAVVGVLIFLSIALYISNNRSSQSSSADDRSSTDPVSITRISSLQGGNVFRYVEVTVTNHTSAEMRVFVSCRFYWKSFTPGEGQSDLLVRAGDSGVVTVGTEHVGNALDEVKCSTRSSQP